jgi:hypothetical protein
MVFPANFVPPLVTITPYSMESLGCELYNHNGISLNSLNHILWPTANLAIFVPFSISVTSKIVKAFILNGDTVSGNVDIGIYSADGTKIVSMGSTAMSGSNALQEFDIADTVLAPGTYYMAMSCSTTGASFQAVTFGSATRLRLMGMVQAASQLPLANAPTFAAISNDYLPMFGLTTRTVI